MVAEVASQRLRRDDVVRSSRGLFVVPCVRDHRGMSPGAEHSRRWRAAALSVVVLLAALTSCGIGAARVISVSESMEPTLVKGETYWVRQVWDYEPERGDVIVFEDEVIGRNIKRVIGIPGDVITCCELSTGQLAVNGDWLDESGYVMQDGTECAVPNSLARPCDLEVGPIPDDYLFVMGDNRANSHDSSVMVCAKSGPDCPPERGLVHVDDVWGVVLDFG